MSVFDIVGPTHAEHLDDEIAAWALQLEEVKEREDTQKAKYTANNIPDLEIAYSILFFEIKDHLQVLKDARLAHSFASAVDLDGEAIAELSQLEAQAGEDRQVAVQMSHDDPDLEAPPPYTENAREDYIEDELARRLDDLLSSNEDFDHDELNVAGPSEPYARRQADALGRLACTAFQCTACTETFRLADVVRLHCEHEYCVPCLRAFILHPVNDHDLALIPPRCCGDPLSNAIIANALTDAEMEDFQCAQVEKDTTDKTYCSNAECGKFIKPEHIEADKATCPCCESTTCATCKGPFHENDCPTDPGLQAVLELGAENEWQRCFSCRTLVAIRQGCNHMTCRCGAEFCYRCGVEWTNPRQCSCDFWIEGNLFQRAEQVVDRAAPPNIRPAERQRRIVQVQEQLRNTDDCDHHGRRKFERINGGYGQRFQCEMCNARHRQFILRCRQCQLDVCLECRLHRV